MRRHFLAEALVNALHQIDLVREGVEHLQIGDRWVVPQRPQSGVVPRQFEDRGQALEILRRELIIAEKQLRPAIALYETRERRRLEIGDHDQHHMLLAGDEFPVALEMIMRDRRGDEAEFLDQEPVLLAEIIGELRGRAQILEAHDHVHPVIGRGERHLDLGDDAVGAIGVRDLVDVVAGELENARACLHRRHLEADDVAGIAQPAPADRADPARTAGNEAADRGGVVGRWMQPDFLTRIGAGLLVEGSYDGAGLGHDPAMADLAHGVELRQIEQDPAGKRHGLAIIAGAGAARRHRDRMFMGRREHLEDLLLGSGRDHDIRSDRVELAPERGGIPEEIPALLAHQSGIFLDLHAVDTLLEGFDVVTRAHG